VGTAGAGAGFLAAGAVFAGGFCVFGAGLVVCAVTGAHTSANVATRIGRQIRIFIEHLRKAHTLYTCRGGRSTPVRGNKRREF